MKKPSASKKSRLPAKPKPDSLSGLLTEVRQLIQSARRGVATVVDTFQVMTNFEIGRRIVEVASTLPIESMCGWRPQLAFTFDHEYGTDMGSMTKMKG